MLKYVFALLFCSVCFSIKAQDLGKKRPWDPAWRRVHKAQINRLKVDTFRYQLPEPSMNAMLISTKGDTTNFEEFLRTHRGRVVVVDLWFSACPPCMESLPVMMSMERRLRKFPVTFVYLNALERIEAWRSFSKSGMISEVKHNYRITNFTTAPFTKTLALSSFPRYLLFDKQGRLCNAFAPEPGKGLEGHVWRLIEDL